MRNVPITAEKPGTSEVDRDFGLETSNSGSRLKPLELANLIYRLHTQRGLPLPEVAKGLGKTLPSIKQTLALRAMPEAVKDQVKAGNISATLAGKISKNVDPDRAAQLIKENLEENKRITGTKNRQTKVTRKTLARDAKPTPPKVEPQHSQGGFMGEAEVPPQRIGEMQPAPLMPHPTDGAPPVRLSDHPTTISPNADNPEVLTSEQHAEKHAAREIPPQAFQPPSRAQDIDREMFAIIGRIAAFAEGFDLNNADNGETLACEFPIKILQDADRLYRSRIGDDAEAA